MARSGVEGERDEPLRRRGPQRVAPVAVLRPVSLYGPWDSPRRLIPSAMRAAREGVELALTAPGVRREWIYVADLVEACLLATDGRADGSVVDLGTGARVDNEVARLAAAAAGGTLLVGNGPVQARPWDREVPPVRTDHARRVLGWQASTPLATGLARTAAWSGASPEASLPADPTSPGPELSVVVPAYGSAGTLPELSRRISAALTTRGTR